MAKLLYGTGLRLMECLRLRVKDVDFAQHQIIVRDGKGLKDRRSMLPDSLVPTLRVHIQRVRLLYEHDLAQHTAGVSMPEALDRKYPIANKEWLWQFVFPSAALSVDPRTGLVRRHHTGVVAENPIPRCRLWRNRTKRHGDEPAAGPWLGRGRPQDWNQGPAGYRPMRGELTRNAMIALEGMHRSEDVMSRCTTNRGCCLPGPAICGAVRGAGRLPVEPGELR